MADYYSYKNKVLAQKRRRKAVLALLVVVAVLCALAGWFWFSRSKPAEADVSTPAQELATDAAQLPTPAPTEAPAAMAPQRILPAVDTVQWDTTAPATQTIDAEFRNTDARMVALPQLGEVPRSHFDTVTFLGDSITQGMELYDSGFLNAKVRAYKGAGPNSVVNNASCNDEIRGVSEVPLDAVAETQPDYVYLLFGTNSLVTPGNEESFIAYYERMIQMLKERLDPGVIYYVQAVPGVQEWVKDRTPGLDNDRIRIVNNLLANMALRNGCYFVNIQEALCYPDGSQIDEFEVKDGIHLQPSGYAAWTDYLTKHTAWNRRSLYLGTNPCYILGT